MERVPRERGVAPERRGGGGLALQRGGRHLAAGHAVEGVVDEDAAELLAARGSLEGVVEADRAEVAVALVGDRDGVGAGAAHARRGGRGAAVRGGDVRGVPVVVGEHAAADGVDEDRAVLQAHLGAALGHELVHDAVSAPGAVVRHARVLPAPRELRVHSFLLDRLHLTSPESSSRPSRRRRRSLPVRPCGGSSSRSRPPRPTRSSRG